MVLQQIPYLSIVLNVNNYQCEIQYGFQHQLKSDKFINLHDFFLIQVLQLKLVGFFSLSLSRTYIHIFFFQGEQFVTPSHVNAKDTKYCPINTPYVQPMPSSTSAYATSAMYRTDSMNYGNDQPVTLSGL